MKTKFIVTFFVMMFLNTNTWAGLSRDDITAIDAEIYGLYTTSDPTCLTGLIATVPLSATSKSVNMAQSPDLGTKVPLAFPIECVVMVMKNTVTMTWNSGNYTSTTSGSSDSVCNTGSSVTLNICNNGSSVTWPTQISTDMTAVGLTETSTCTNATGTEVIPVYISTYAACTGDSTVDTAAGYSCSNNTFQPPTAANSTTKGIKLTTPDASDRYQFKIDPDGSIGAQNGSCTSTSPPKFGFQ